jgi:predicted metal-dependent enzyme (double-stranded beta helix superfamily)
MHSVHGLYEEKCIGHITAAPPIVTTCSAVMHSVVNPLGRFTGAIHVYGGDFFGMPRSEWAPDTLEERPFDVERARRAYAVANERGTMDTP